MLLRSIDVLRDIARGGLAGLVAGFVVGGLGGRLVMTLAALLNPDATGQRTENGELIGAFTVQGTLGLMLFGGLGAGMAAGVVWVVISPWVPSTGPRRWLLAALLGIALGSFLLIRSTNTDFIILGPDEVLLAMLLALVGLVSFAVAWLDEQLDRRLPRLHSTPVVGLAVYGVVAGIGLLIVPLVVDVYFTTSGCHCARGPVMVGWSLAGVGIVTVAWWTLRIVRDQRERPRPLVVAGSLGVAVAAILGVAYLVPILDRILRIA